MFPAVEIEILFEDNFLVAVNKPPLIPVHATHDLSRPHVQGILEKNLGRSLVLFHRLDLETTGVLVFGKDPSINAYMTDLFRDRNVQKKYWLVAEGRWLEEWREVKTFIKKVNGGAYKNVPKGQGGAFAHTLFVLKKTNGSRSWVEATLLTGRTHQIRLHCLEKNHCICGDRLYGKKDPHGVPMALHAREISFLHPKSKENLTIVAPPPDYWGEYWLSGLDT